MSITQKLCPSTFVKPGSEGLLSPLMPWLMDKDVSEIMINTPEAVFVERLGEIRRHELPVLTYLYLQRLFQMIANESNQRLDEENPLLSANLFEGSRVQLILPIIGGHHVMSIRKASIKQLSLTEYNESGFYAHTQPFSLTNEIEPSTDIEDEQLRALYSQRRWGEFMALAIASRKNIVVSGGTSSGKTTYLNACLNEIDKSERLILIEDTRELKLTHPNCLSLLVSRGHQWVASVTMGDLIEASLRLRPDRLIIGELRGREVMDFVSACSTGHEGSFTSIHANNPRMAIARMVALYKKNHISGMIDADIMRELHSVIDIILQVKKTNNARIATYCYYKGA